MSLKSYGEVMKSALGSFCFIEFIKRDLPNGCQLQDVFILSNCLENIGKPTPELPLLKG